MPIPEVDYDDASTSFDEGRSLSDTKEALWTDLFGQHLGLNTTSRLLDVGCGTGRFSLLAARQFRCAVVGIDPSLSMLAKAKAKCYNGNKWLLGQAEAIPFPDNVFDACLASQVVHHFQDRRQAFAEMYRVLRRGGRLGVRYSSHAQLRTILDYRFFPSALQIDQERMPDTGVMRELIRTVGFRGAKEHTVCQELFESTDDYLKKIQGRYASALWLIPEEEYQGGLREAEAYFEARQLDAGDRLAYLTFLVSVK
jgi:ubiquinone/menaquinone biosynthesis C-methylase UbiE